MNSTNGPGPGHRIKRFIKNQRRKRKGITLTNRETRIPRTKGVEQDLSNFPLINSGITSRQQFRGTVKDPLPAYSGNDLIYKKNKFSTKKLAGIPLPKSTKQASRIIQPSKTKKDK